MLDPWLRRYERDSFTGNGLVVSTVLHALLIGGAAYATQRAADLPGPPLYNRAYYLAPPNTRPQQDHSIEQLEYIALPVPGTEAGTGTLQLAIRGIPKRPAVDASGDRGRDYATTREKPYVPGDDSVYTEIEVDSSAMRFPWSAAPQYPARLLRERVEGVVRVQYVVDTTGFADTTSFRVVSATDSDFAVAVRSALPNMRFAPAKIGELRVRQLVQQDFTFRIQRPSPPITRKSST